MKAYIPISSNKQRFYLDYKLLIILILFSIVSVFSIYLTQPLLSNYLLSQQLYIKQIIWYLISFSIMFIIIQLGSDRLITGVNVLYYILLVFLMILVIDKYIIDINDSLIKPINGATAWYNIPLVGSFQPSEFMKVILIIKIGITIYQHNIDKQTFTYKDDIELFFKLFKLLVLPILLILVQPDNGIPLIIFVSLLFMLYVGGIKKEWFIIGGLVLFIIIVIFIYLLFFNRDLLNDLFNNNYILYRIYGWLFNEEYYLSYGNQLYTSLLSIGNSGLLGSGLMESVVPLSEVYTDFIFTIIAQNFGFIGTFFTILLILILDLYLLYLVYITPYNVEKMIIVGLCSMLIYQQIQNISMVIGLLPITGITLPLISYGGSSLLSYFIPLSFVFNGYSNMRNNKII